jgi:hypothetical protein
MNQDKSFFFKSGPFESRQSISDLQRNHANSLAATHFHVNIRYHVNSTSPTITFSIQNESRHFE